MKNFYEQFKFQIVTVLIIFLGFGIYTAVFGPIPFNINSINTTKTDLFSASGEGTITAVPNSATVDAGVTTQGKTVLEAQNKANDIANKIINEVKKLGISEKDIKTTNYSVNPDYGQGEIQPMMIQRGESNIVGYTVTENLQIKVKQIENVNKVIDTATASGANLIGGASFTFSDEKKKELETKATQMAVADAKDKAQVLANAAGVRLGKIINVVSSSNNPGPLYRMDAMQKSGDTVTIPTTVAPGQNTITVGVTIYYQTY